MWMGGWAPLGYEVRDRKLAINETYAGLARSIFQRFVNIGSMTKLARELIAENVRNKNGKPERPENQSQLDTAIFGSSARTEVNNLAGSVCLRSTHSSRFLGR